jgi:WXG100 family type VII secretion target
MAGDPSELRVRYENVQEMANTLRQVADRIKNDLTTMDAAIKTVTDTWEGAAHQGYLAMQADYRGRADHIDQLLEAVARTIENGKQNYHATDVKAARYFTAGY